jgi:predicted transcriptional regulator
MDTTTLMNSGNRKMILDLIGDEPGIHYRKIGNILSLKQGVLSYHLNLLEKYEMIRSVQDGYNRRFYLFEVKVRPVMHLSDIQQRIIELVYFAPGISKTNISNRIGISKPLVSYHIRILRELNLVRVMKKNGATSCFVIMGDISNHIKTLHGEECPWNISEILNIMREPVMGLPRPEAF